MKFAERFKQIREYLIEKYEISNSQRAFAKTIGVIGPTISNIESETYLPKADLLINLKKTYPEVNLNWLLVEEGNMLMDAAPQELTGDVHLLHLLIHEKDERIELMKQLINKMEMR